MVAIAIVSWIRCDRTADVIKSLLKASYAHCGNAQPKLIVCPEEIDLRRGSVAAACRGPGVVSKGSVSQLYDRSASGFENTIPVSRARLIELAQGWVPTAVVSFGP